MVNWNQYTHILIHWNVLEKVVSVSENFLYHSREGSQNGNVGKNKSRVAWLSGVIMKQRDILITLIL